MKTVSLILSAIVASSAMAQTPNPPPRSGDRDGAPPSAEEAFKRRDANKDGFLSKDEMKGSRIEAEFDKLDANHDAKLSLDEYKAGRQAIGRGEGRGERRAELRRDDRAPADRDRAPPPPNAKELFKELDKDHDHFVSKQEVAQTPAAERFDAVDTNHDGKLSFKEFRAGLPQPPPHHDGPRHRGDRAEPADAAPTHA